ncbi:RHS repeat-associated core domain-containing protein [Streptomyces sp. Ncost-T6T-1]|uniref:putative T7SS-secreted protein n=1 Tax=Streptomyces sp. Ncost-T6T-1 TaxID=1100828 RepID=UPI000805D2F0|nr:RHS repeat-associated core domain-containing protein [Streptomyces sp. Ncost-T6T-1]SBV00099.1 RHS repeat-associated core domain-containing protein [Streptomyces sp. Ncost-T6T-1]
MGFGDFVSDITPDVIEDAVEDGVEWAGDRIEDAGNWTGDRLDDVGWESGADWVREKSRSVANRMGAEVDEMDLGQTEDKTKLIYGSPSKIRASATHLRKLQGSFDQVGGGLKGVDSSAIKGQAADAFRDSVSIEPPKWFKAADAFEKAAGALDSFAGTVEWAQGQAQTAIDKWKAGTKASEEARDAYNEKTTTYNKAVDVYNAKPADDRDPSSLPPKPGAFKDPGTGRMEEAQSLLAEARKQRNTAAETARKAVTAARDSAPPKPRYAEQAMDGLAEYEVIKTHIAGGVVKGAAGIVNFARSVNPTDPYNITHPAEYALALNNTAAGLVRAANDPWGTGKQMIDGFMKDPAEGFGRLLPDLALTAATGGAGAGVKGARVVKEAADIASDARKLENRTPEGTHNRPDNERTSAGTDPVDLASGRMYLPQTDVVLPGVLPLAFTRRVESGYTAGRFFGPSWSSTVDERLEIDANGVIHVTDDGLLITYPHPVPGLPTRPERGTSRSTLSRDEAGDYTLTDPETLLTKHFAGPDGTEPGDDGTAWLVQITDRNSNTIGIDRGDEGTPLALVHSAGHRLLLATAEARVTELSVVDGTGAVHPVKSYGYTSGDLTTVAQPSGSALTFAYDEAHRTTAWIDSNGSRYTYAYDEHDRVVSAGGEAGHVALTLAYSDPAPGTGHRVTALTTADGHTTRHLIDAGCRVLATTDPLGHTTRFTYDGHGRLLTRTDPLGRTTSFTYDEQGRPHTVTQPDGSRLTTTRDASERRTETRGPDGARRLQEFDERGNLTALTDAAGHTTRWLVDPYGRTTSVTDTLGAVTTVRCDAAGMPMEVTDPAGATTVVRRDVFGRPAHITDAAGGTTRLEWDADGRLARRVAPGGVTESWTYDGEGNCLTYTDPAGGVSSFEYTHFDLPAARTHPDGARYTFRYDAHLQLTHVVNPRGMTWTYEYDAAGRTIAETDFDGRTVSYGYDAAGQLSTRTDALGRTISFERDQLGRVVEKDADGRVTTYAYDQAGRLLHATGPDSELLYQYDRRGQVKAELVDGYAMTYAYDALGRRTRRTTPTGQVTTYAYDSGGRPEHLTAGEHRIGFAHDVAGRETARVFGDALTLTSTWDAAGRLATENLTVGERAVNSRSYAYRPDGHLTALTDGLSGTRTFDLDAVGRVTTVHARGWTERYVYDADGNQTEAAWPAGRPGGDGAGPRSYAGTKLVRAGGTHYEYDALGRVTLRRKTRLSRKPDTWQYAWDAENRLSSVITPDGTRWRYRYDPLGRRTAKQRLSSDGCGTVVEEVRFAWDGLTLCEQTAREPGLPNTVVLTWDHRAGVPLAQTERIITADTRQEEVDRRFFAIATDLVGAPTELVDPSGDIAWRSRTTLWGATAWPRTSTAYTPLRFPGQYDDPETGLHYNFFRHYDPEAARYVSPDPLGLAAGPNPVAYVDNPFTWCDPLGLMPKCPRERAQKVADQVVERAQEGKMRKSSNYHADTRHQFSDERVLEILKNPDAVYQSQGQRGNLTFRQGEDVVITKGPGAGGGDVITAYGPSGTRGESGAGAFGGSPDDPGLPVTHDDIVNGNIPDSRGGTMAPADQIR